MSGPRNQKGFQLDVGLCTGCGACAVACAVENELPWGTSWRWIETFNPDRLPDLPLYHLSLACNHCADAPCMKHCPALAYAKDPSTGAVLLNEDHCIGCRYCTWACPYDAPRYRADLGTVSKCTFCHRRLREGLTPACVGQCPTGALRFGDLDRLEGPSSVAGFPETDADPSIRFPGGGRRRSPVHADGTGTVVDARVPRVEAAQGSAPTPPAPITTAVASKTHLASEWPLVVFTLLCAALAGMMAVPGGRRLLTLPPFLLVTGMAAGASTLHLGRRLRAWRAVLNLRRSWLSREVALFGAFVGVSGWHLWGFGAPEWSGPLAGVLGLALLYAVDRVYAVTRTRGLPVHSARVLLTGIAVAAWASGLQLLFAAVALLKGVQYSVRSLRPGGRGRSHPAVGLVRLGSLVLAAATLVATGAQGAAGTAWASGAEVVPSPLWVGIALTAFATGEVVDRCEFYLDLTVPTPARQIAYDAALASARVADERNVLTGVD